MWTICDEDCHDQEMSVCVQYNDGPKTHTLTKEKDGKESGWEQNFLVLLEVGVNVAYTHCM